MALAARTSMSMRMARCAPRAAVPRSIKGRTSVVVRAEVMGKASEGQTWMKKQAGISGPLGFFDPLGFSESSQFSVGEAQRFKESELTHGRVAMLAALGWLVQEEFHPLFGGQIGGPAFVHFQKVEQILPQFWEVILFAIGLSEAYRISRTYNDPREEDQIKPNHTPGDLGFDPLGLLPKEPQARYEMQTKEINNGRLAMIGIAGMAAQEEVDHTTIWRGLFAAASDPAPPAAFPPY